jgi:hypothetical protein
MLQQLACQCGKCILIIDLSCCDHSSMVVEQQASAFRPHSGYRLPPQQQVPRKLECRHFPSPPLGCCASCRFIADGVIPHDAFCSIYSSRHKLSSSGSSTGAGQQSSASRPTNSSSSSSSSNDPNVYTDPQQEAAAALHSDPSNSTANSYRRYRLNATPDNSRHNNGSSGRSSGVGYDPAGIVGGADHHVGNSTPTAARAARKADPAAAGGREAAAGACGLEVPPPQRERFVFFRGVQWAAPEVNSVGAALLGTVFLYCLWL